VRVTAVTKFKQGDLWCAKKLIRGPAELRDGQYYVVGGTDIIIGDSATVEYIGDSATVESIGDWATVIAYKVIDPTCLKSTTAVLIDRSVYDKVTCHVGKAGG
jgi:hypothetical protein